MTESGADLDGVSLLSWVPSRCPSPRLSLTVSPHPAGGHLGHPQGERGVRPRGAWAPGRAHPPVGPRRRGMQSGSTRSKPADPGEAEWGWGAALRRG